MNQALVRTAIACILQIKSISLLTIKQKYTLVEAIEKNMLNLYYYIIIVLFLLKELGD